MRKKLKNNKPYWNDKLYDLWCKMSQSEKFISKFRGPRHIREFLRREYIYKRNIFDKTLRKTEREYNRQVIDNMEEVCTSNPREFSKLLNKLGTRKCTDIPVKVYTEEGQHTDNIESVLDNWHQDFKTLLNRPGDVGVDDNFYNECIQEKDDLEQNNLDITPELNVPITLEKILIFVSELKN